MEAGIRSPPAVVHATTVVHSYRARGSDLPVCKGQSLRYKMKNGVGMQVRAERGKDSGGIDQLSFNQLFTQSLNIYQVPTMRQDLFRESTL